MFDLTANQKIKFYRIVSLCALLAVIFFVAAGILAIFMSLPAVQSSLNERLNFIAQNYIIWKILFFLVFMFWVLQLPCWFGLFQLAQRHLSHLVFWSMVLGGIGALLCMQSIYPLATAIPRMAKIYVTTNDELLKYSIFANFNSSGLLQMHSLSFSQTFLGLAFLACAGIFSGISLLKTLKLTKITGIILLISGSLGLIGFIGHLIENQIIEMAAIGQIFFYFCALIPAGIVFYQEAGLNEAIKK